MTSSGQEPPLVTFECLEARVQDRDQLQNSHYPHYLHYLHNHTHLYVWGQDDAQPCSPLLVDALVKRLNGPTAPLLNVNLIALQLSQLSSYSCLSAK